MNRKLYWNYCWFSLAALLLILSTYTFLKSFNNLLIYDSTSSNVFFWQSLKKGANKIRWKKQLKIVATSLTFSFTQNDTVGTWRSGKLQNWKKSWASKIFNISRCSFSVSCRVYERVSSASSKLTIFHAQLDDGCCVDSAAAHPLACVIISEWKHLLATVTNAKFLCSAQFLHRNRVGGDEPSWNIFIIVSNDNDVRVLQLTEGCEKKGAEK